MLTCFLNKAVPCLSFYTSDLLARIAEATKPDGTVEQIGHILVNWVCGKLSTTDCFLDVCVYDESQVN